MERERELGIRMDAQEVYIFWIVFRHPITLAQTCGLYPPLLALGENVSFVLVLAAKSQGSGADLGMTGQEASVLQDF